jgi:hypothetical protein
MLAKKNPTSLGKRLVVVQGNGYPEEAFGRFSKNGASFAVALNCGIGSSSLNAEAKAFAKLQRVGGANSSYCGLK